jgi:hypothetical protein
MSEVDYRCAERRLWNSVGLTPHESFVTLPRLGVEARVQEVGEGEPVLFIHGGPNAGSPKPSSSPHGRASGRSRVPAPWLDDPIFTAARARTFLADDAEHRPPSTDTPMEATHE